MTKPNAAQRIAADRERSRLAPANRWDVVALVIAFVTAGIFAACWVGGLSGFVGWCIGATDILCVGTAWKVLR
jgi:hypothetical protein